MGMIRTKLQAVLNPRSGFYNDSDMIDKLYNRPGYKAYSAIYVYLELCTIYLIMDGCFIVVPLPPFHQQTVHQRNNQGKGKRMKVIYLKVLSK